MKVLIISHTSLNTHNNMGKTMVSLFSAFEKSELCQLYIYPMLPDIDMCASWYRVTDKDALRGCIKRRVRGRVVGADEIDSSEHRLYEQAGDEKLYRNPKNKTAIRVLLRDVMWKLSPWYNRQLEDWVTQQRPTCIFVAPGVPKFLYDIALKISRRFRLPIVTYICDDYYFMNPDRSVLDRLKQKLLVRKTDRLFDNTTHLVAICDEISNRYAEHFGVPATTVMTGASRLIAKEPVVHEERNVMIYMGNIRYNRNLVLARIGESLDELNCECGTDYRLDIYSMENDPEILSVFEGINSIKLCGFVSGEEFEKTFSSARIHVHVEAFDEHSMELTRNSVSTKIADSLASGIPLFAFGPAEVASMGHLIRNDCALTVTDERDLKDTLRQMFLDDAVCRSKAEKGLEVARSFHDATTQSQKVKRVISEASNENITG